MYRNMHHPETSQSSRETSLPRAFSAATWILATPPSPHYHYVRARQSLSPAAQPLAFDRRLSSEMTVRADRALATASDFKNSPLDL